MQTTILSPLMSWEASSLHGALGCQFEQSKAMREILAAVAMTLALVDCTNGREDRVLGGALIGGGTGALVGGLAGETAGAAIAGGLIGAAAGAIIADADETGLVLLLEAPSSPLRALLIRLTTFRCEARAPCDIDSVEPDE